MIEAASTSVKTKITKKKGNKKRQGDPLLKEIDSIKRLIMLLLIKAGTSQSEIAVALDIDQGDLSRMLPARKFKPFNKTM